MTTEVTQGIRVSVETEYQAEYSNPAQQHFVFTYRILIENTSDKTMQLKSRHWEIFDATYPKREVDGEGVVGKQPVLEPGQRHQYVSGCNLRSGMGRMCGFYLMERIIDGKQFRAIIPDFSMTVPFRLN
jgi:ApaG protein